MSDFACSSDAILTDIPIIINKPSTINTPLVPIVRNLVRKGRKVPPKKVIPLPIPPITVTPSNNRKVRKIPPKKVIVVPIPQPIESIPFSSITPIPKSIKPVRKREVTPPQNLKLIETPIKLNNIIEETSNIIVNNYDEVNRTISFTPFILSTCVLKAHLKLPKPFDEREIISELNEITKTDPRIDRVSCNGICFQKSGTEEIPRIKSKRGRKPSEKTLKKRERKKNNEQFRSQITIKTLINGVKYTCKIFRNGQMIIPGVKKDRDINGVFETLILISSMFTSTYKETVLWEICDISMQYYKLKIDNKLVRIKLDVLELLIKKILLDNDIDKKRIVTRDDYLEQSTYTNEEITKSIAGVSFLPKKQGITIGVSFKMVKQNKRKYETNIKLYQTGSILLVHKKNIQYK